MFCPRDRQSIQPAVIGQSALAALSPAMNASMFGIRSLSCQIHGDGTRTILNSTSRMCPVSPMPPIVARNRSRSTVGLHVDDAAVRDAQLQLGDVRAEAARLVMVLAVHVGGDHARPASRTACRA